MHLELKGRVEEYEREKHKYNNDVLELQKEVIVHYITCMSVTVCVENRSY